MPFEDQLARSMRDTGEQFTPTNLTELVSSGVVDGRKRRRRRNVAVLGGSAALALIAVGGTLAPTLLAGPAQGHAQAASSSHAPTATASNAEQAKQLLAALESVLPKGGHVTDTVSSWSNAPVKYKNTTAVARLVFTDGQGSGSVAVSLTKVIPHAYPLPSCPPNPAYTPGDVCHSYPLPGGGQVIVDQGYENPTQASGTKSWNAWVSRADGSLINISEYNATSEKGAPVSRPTPPLSAEQLKAAALSDVWAPLLKAIPKPTPWPGGGVGAPQGPSGAAILRTINSLLPQGVSAVNKEGEVGYSQEQLKDGTSGLGLIGVNVQHWDLVKDASSLAQLYSGATVLPDGSKLAVHQTGGDKGGAGAVEWVVDLLRPNGQRVVAMEFNEARQGAAADRALPVLTLAQLKALVTNPVWKTLG